MTREARNRQLRAQERSEGVRACRQPRIHLSRHIVSGSVFSSFLQNARKSADVKYGLEARPEPGAGGNTEATSCRSRVSECRTPSTSSLGLASPSSATQDQCHLSSQNSLTFYFSEHEQEQSTIFENCVDTLIHIFNAETFVQDEIQDARKHTDTRLFGGGGGGSSKKSNRAQHPKTGHELHVFLFRTPRGDIG